MAHTNASAPSFDDSDELLVIASPSQSAIGSEFVPRRVKREMDDLDAGSDESCPAAKTPRFGEDGRVCFLKLLIPNNVAGCIIGKGGDIMLRLKELTKANVKMGKANEVYPTTNDRVCALSGTPDAVLQAVHFIVTRLTARFNGTMRGQSESSALVEDFLRDETSVTKVTFVVTDSTAFLLIGKRGDRLLGFQGDDFSMSVSPRKSPVDVFGERLIHCFGPFYRVKEMVGTIIQAVLSDPKSAVFRNVAYASEHDTCMNLPVPAAGDVSSTDGIRNRRAPSSVTPAPVVNFSMDGVQLFFSPLHGIKNIVSSDMLEDIRIVLEENCEDVRTVTEALGALASLSSKGMLALSYGRPYRRAGSSTVGRFDARKNNENGDHGGHGTSHQPNQNHGSFPHAGLNLSFDGGADGQSAAFRGGRQQQGPGPVEIGLNENQFGHFNHRGKEELQQWENITGAKIEVISKPSGENLLRLTGDPKDVSYAETGLKKKLDAIDKLFNI